MDATTSPRLLEPQRFEHAVPSAAVAYPHRAFIEGMCEALGPDASLRKALFVAVLWDAGERGITQKNLQKAVTTTVRTTQSTSSRTVRALMSAGLVEVFLCSAARDCLLRLTGVGRALLRSLSESHELQYKHAPVDPTPRLEARQSE